MSVITIDRVDLAPPSEAIRALAVDRPQPGTGLQVYDIEAMGWVLGATAPAQEILIHSGGQLVRRTPVDQIRVDVEQQFPGLSNARASGWRTSVNVVGLEPGAPLRYSVRLADETTHPLATIVYRRQPMVTGYTPRLQPMMLTTIGRAGTTWTMRLLSEHPSIVIHRAHPYELRVARHWLHSFKILTEPRDLHHSAHPDSFQNSRDWAGHNPFYPTPLATTPGLWTWYGKTYIEEAAAAAQRWIDECYLRIAAGQNVPNPRYFAEKHRADSLPWLVWELYPKAKEIFLVRDFRDVISSMLSFNQKHGRPVFGPKTPTSDEDFVRFIRNGPVRLISNGWASRQERGILIRYEDLISEPEATVRTMLDYLELDASPATVSGMLERASAENPEMRRHRTSTAVASSIGRWRTSLSPGAQAVCQEVLSDVLEQFRYQV